jgi:hypothetical protein
LPNNEFPLEDDINKFTGPKTIPPFEVLFLENVRNLTDDVDKRRHYEKSYFGDVVFLWDSF